MKKLVPWYLVLAGLLIGFGLNAQNKVYSTFGGELIFSFADVEVNGESVENVLRFTLFLHLGNYWHLDFTDNVGMFTGFAIRNVGMTTNEGPDQWVRRSYSAGIPLAMKFGTFSENLFFFGGVEPELMFHYKQKRRINKDNSNKEKKSEWFSNRTNLINPSVFAGVQFPGGINVKFKAYLLDFLNNDFRETIDGVEVMPYQGWDTQLFYISASFNLRHRWGKSYRDKKDRTKEPEPEFQEM